MQKTASNQRFDMRDLILAMVKPLVDYPDSVSVEAEEGTTAITYKLSVHAEDMGKVIGKQGRVAKSIRTVVYAAAGSKQQKKIFLEIVE